MREPCEQPWQHDLELDVVFRHVDRPADLLLQGCHLKREPIAAPYLLIDLKIFPYSERTLPSPAFRRRVASSLPSLWGMETMNGWANALPRTVQCASWDAHPDYSHQIHRRGN